MAPVGGRALEEGPVPGLGVPGLGVQGGVTLHGQVGQAGATEFLVIPCVKSATVLVFTCATVIAILDIQAF